MKDFDEGYSSKFFKRPGQVQTVRNEPFVVLELGSYRTGRLLPLWEKGKKKRKLLQIAKKCFGILLTRQSNNSGGVMDKTFRKQEIIKIAFNLHTQGKSWQYIADHLSKRGYTNSKGRPYTEGGIWTLVTVANDPTYKARMNQKKKPLQSANFPSMQIMPQNIPQNSLAIRDKVILDLKKSIIDLEGVPSEKKLELIELTDKL
jgi:hypothetical protein